MLFEAKNQKSILWTAMFMTFLLATNLQTCQCNQPLPCVWRITLPLSDVQAGFIPVNTPFLVSYLDSCAQELQWDTTDGCTVHNQSSLDTSITCQHPGYHTITPEVQSCNHCVPDGKAVTIRSDPLCYRWYAKSVNKLPLWSVDDAGYGQWRLETLRLWVVDWTKEGNNKWNKNAITPSQLSADLTRLFHSKGQRPSLQQVHPTNQQQLQAVNSTFLQDLGFWEVFVRIPAYSELELKVSGRLEIAAHTCFIGDTTVLLTNHWLPMMFEDETIQLHYTSGHPTRLVQDPCASHVAILMSKSSLLHTEDGFQTSKNISLPSHLVQSLNPEIDSIAFTPTHLLLLMDSKVFALYRTMDNITQVIGLSGQSVIKGRDWCIPSSLHKSHLAVSFNTSSLFLISTLSLSDHRLNSQEIPLPLSIFQGLGFTAGLTLEIHDVAFDSFSNQLSIAVMVTQNSHSSLVFLLFDITLASWTHLPFWLDGMDTYGSISMLFTKSAYNASLLFWDQKTLYFSHHCDKYGVFTVMGSGSTMLNASIAEVINQVSVSQSGDIVVLMSSNCLYYSRAGLATLIRLPASELPTTSTNLMFDRLSNLFIVRNENISMLRWHYPLVLEVGGALHNVDNSCPYERFEHGGTASIYYLDMGDAVKLWTSLTFPNGAGVNLQVISSPSSSNVLRIMESDVWAYYPGWLAVNKTLMIQPTFNPHDLNNYEEDLNVFTGDVVVEVGPDQDDIICKKPGSMVARFMVGCPPGKNIRVRTPDSCLQFSNYTVPRDAYLMGDGSDPHNSKVVDYDWSTYGCPVPSHYRQPFRPVIDLYNHDDFVTELNSNYVVFEEQRRTDFNYNASMWQAGCHSVALNQPSIFNATTEITASQSYQSCFVLNITKDSAALRSQRYKVLNSTGVASIVWTASRNNSIFQFTATVVDPGYSFCHLQTKFAVRVYGHPAEVQEKPVTEVSLGIFTVLTFALGAISYVYFRKGHVKKLQQQLFDYDTD